MTPTQADKDFHAVLTLTSNAWLNLGFEERLALRRQIADAIVEAREQGRREMQAECAKLAEEFRSLYDKQPERIVAAIRALK